MKKRLNLTIDEDIYEIIGKLPRTVSVSEVVSYILRCFYESAKKGKVLLSDSDIQKLIDSDPKLQDFQARLIEHWGPGIKKIDSSIEKVKKTVGIKKDKK